MKIKPIIYEEVSKYFKLDEEGRLWNLHRGEWNPCYQNTPYKLTGYLPVTFKGTMYLQHRIIYCLATKQDVPPDLQVDHLNGNRTNNSITNLRLVTHRENNQNRVKHREGGLVGASYHARNKKWRASIALSNGEKIGLGNFDTELEANQRYIEALELIYLTKEQIQKHFGVAQFTSEYKGVSWRKASGKWRACITHNSKTKHLGYFQTEQEAHEAILNFKKE